MTLRHFDKQFNRAIRRPGRSRCATAIAGHCLVAGFLLSAATCLAQPEGFKGVIAEAGEDYQVLHLVPQPLARALPLPKTAKVVPLDDLQFTGPQPSHPFVLGNFAADAKWGIVNGYLQVIEGKNGALQLAWADDFVLEGIAEQSGVGGWFFLLGWDQDRGYALSNVTMRESGSPWFLSELRGGKAIEGRTKEFEKFEWKGEQPFYLTVKDEALSLEIGKFKVFDKEPLPGYTAGRVVLGVYDTRYGPRPVRVRSLRIKSLAEPPAGE